VLHDLVDRHLGEAFPIEQASCARHDPLARGLLVLRRIGHRGSCVESVLISGLQKDVLEHLLIECNIPESGGFRGTDVQIGTILETIVAGFTGLVVVSYAMEMLRPQPRQPVSLPWAPGVPIECANLDGIRVRYIKTGSGPTLVLLHTLRTQVDLFEKVIPDLSRHFTVYAYDYPGHGWSDIPPAEYAPEDFYRWTIAFLNALDIRNATLVGISIGGTIALVLTARQNPCVRRVVAINAYDDLPAGGIRRTSIMARLILGPADVPILGSTLMRLRIDQPRALSELIIRFANVPRSSAASS
jgi:hypothetical protein